LPQHRIVLDFFYTSVHVARPARSEVHSGLLTPLEHP
jgi:hypothetical protein